MKPIYSYLLKWLLDEKIILLSGAFLFTLLAMALIKWDARESYVMLVLGLSSSLVGALIRGIVGPNGNLKDPDDPK